MARRRWELDALRGLMLVLMFATHLPTKYSIGLGQPLGFVSAAEGFVILSAFMAGMINTRKAEKHGIASMRRSFLRRALEVYGCHVACLLLLFTLIATLGLVFHRDEFVNYLGFYLSQPLTGLWAGILLIYNPPLLDILPLYVMLLLVSPFILSHGIQHGWRGIFVISTLLWFVSQFEFSAWLYQGLVMLTGLPVPFNETGSFETFAWQFLWVFGLWLGSLDARGVLRERKPFPRGVVIAALLTAAIFFIWRHIVGQVPFGENEALNALQDKWHLGPLRMLNFFALLILILHYGERMRQSVPRLRMFEVMGAASLPVFCVHLVMVLLALALLGQNMDHRNDLGDLLLLMGGLFGLYLVAKFALGMKHKPALPT
ncbi:OpgC domain-containing protein [uncultured Oxalicibacterium sp.]|uniref:OpgC domain-containing protein n=1 Tax=uncultured Oxalicibacterium sp. TaxID=1168540 RepID=UPI0025EB3CBA|nr:OpgC domain-containing protein [uncultured Oxalicibacterium sp.]